MKKQLMYKNIIINLFNNGKHKIVFIIELIFLFLFLKIENKKLLLKTTVKHIFSFFITILIIVFIIIIITKNLYDLLLEEKMLYTHILNNCLFLLPLFFF